MAATRIGLDSVCIQQGMAVKAWSSRPQVRSYQHLNVLGYVAYTKGV